MTAEEKFSKAVKLADAMYYAAQMISTDASHLRKAIEDWWNFKNVELKESEDERIRERLIEFFKDWGKTRSHCWSISISDILAWLEKQGESYTKRDVDDAYIEGMVFAKDELKKQSEQKHACSEEDETRLQACIDCLQTESLMGKVDNVMTNWLKSIKQRIAP